MSENAIDKTVELRKSTRIESIDLLRGIVMIIMALDHARDYFHHSTGIAGTFSPTDLDQTTPEIFFTRIITHICAPVFIFLAGTSAYLYGLKRTKAEVSKFLVTRGLWLVLVEIIVMNFVWWFDPGYELINLQVIWTIGICMMTLSVLIFLPKKWLLIVGLIIVTAHNLLEGIQMEGKSFISIIWYIIYQGGFVTISDNHFVQFLYPVLPWIGVIVLGYIFGSLYKRNVREEIRRKWLIGLGLGCIFLFIILRFFNIYGSVEEWSTQENSLFTFLSFLNLEKYPPSLNFLLFNLGIGFLLLYIIENARNRITSFIIVFGRVPFFYYVLHVLLLHVLAIIILIITGENWRTMVLNRETFMSGLLQDYGYSLFVVYLMSIVVVALLYYPCKLYMNYKMKNRTKWWLSYL